MSDTKPPSDLSMDEVLATIRRIIAEDEQSTGGAGGSGRTGPAAAAADDVLELTQALNEDGTVRHLAPIGSTSRPAELLREPPPPAAPEKPEPEARSEPLLPPEEPSLSPQPQPQPTPQQKEAAEDRLVSEAASLGAGAALARLASTPPPAAGEAPTVGDRPLDEVVRDELRPMLRSWLDENLPQIVERMVEAEIARIAARSGPG
jgi:cell pole-organizing protein PopZ